MKVFRPFADFSYPKCFLITISILKEQATHLVNCKKLGHTFSNLRLPTS